MTTASLAAWTKNAHIVEDVYGGFVDWEEQFYNCPECGDSVYAEDWTDEDFECFICPICFYREEDEEFEDCDYEMGYNPYLGCFDDDC